MCLMRHNASKITFISAVAGTIAAALCCFTPLLVGLLALTGFSVLTPYLDYVLLPAMAVLPVVAIISYRKWRRAQD
jgi:mercuric ion transport protein